MKHVASPWCECSRCFTDSCAPPPRKVVVAAAHTAIACTEDEQAVLDAIGKAHITEHSRVVFDTVQDECDLCRAELARREAAK